MVTTGIIAFKSIKERQEGTCRKKPEKDGSPCFWSVRPMFGSSPVQFALSGRLRCALRRERWLQMATASGRFRRFSAPPVGVHDRFSRRN